MGLELGAVLWFAGLRSRSVALLFGLGAVGLGLAVRDRHLIADIGREYDVHLLVYALIFFAALPVTLLVTVDAGTNVYGHLVGLATGFLLTLTVISGRTAVALVMR